ncbi:hypothetical protein SAMD00019534_012610 [Acytostelium subglobosum LB1]|uniref:hypothetical protein n=1 Tax=Acytostelium subglobosum LB1 TaxID=1410327 RepID=UPI000644E49F|nr:hypothetical protein SAMD00019534_012610 [Acytostelium subglobosum LB1]GAM18086.1 hypothetical protein SAMD00019534_012610 [Acytostelium subglobosum LB1]|eukprot:XP_012758682.1 hypothetical protein SAMD00019534_012610 [Acytostelium subglobosum LB1]
MMLNRSNNHNSILAKSVHSNNNTSSSSSRQPSLNNISGQQQQSRQTTTTTTTKTMMSTTTSTSNNGSGNGSGGGSGGSSGHGSGKIPSSSSTSNMNEYTNTSVSSSTLDYSNIEELGVILKSLKLIEKNRYTANIKCAILGSNFVGKTSFMRRFSSGEFDPMETTTIGAIRTLHTIHYSTLSLNLEIWDTGGHERLKGLLPFYLKNCNCIIVMFDVTSIDSYYKSLDILTRTKKMVPEGSIFLLVANKVDIGSRAVSQVDIAKACSESEIGHISWCEISARTGHHIHEPFHLISQHISNMINAMRTNHRIEKMHSKLTSTPIFNFVEFEGSDEGDSITKSDLAMIRNNMYTCTERSFRSIDPQVVVLKLDVRKIMIESTGGLFNKFLSKRSFLFKEVSGDSNGGGSNANSDDFQNSGEYKGSFCLVLDKFHPRRIEVRKLQSGSSSSPPLESKNEIVLLCEYREHLVKTFKSLCSVSIPISEGHRGGDRNDFLYCYKEYLKNYTKEPIDLSIEHQIIDSAHKSTQPFTSLDLSRVIRDDKNISALSRSLEWNGSLTSLDLSYNTLDTLDQRSIADLLNTVSNSVSIVNLDLTSNNLGSPKVKNLLIEFFKPSLKLKSLILNSNDLGSTANLIIQSLSSNTNLVTLGLASNNLHNDNAQTISQMLLCNNTLETLDLSNNLIEEEGAIFLRKAFDKSSAKPNTTLSKLLLASNSKITQNSLNVLQSLTSPAASKKS